MKIRTMTIAMIVLLLVVALGTMVVMSATAATATRTSPYDCVEPGANFTVTVTADDYGLMGVVTETLCADWEYVGVTGAVDDVRIEGSNVKFLLLNAGPRTFTYTVLAPDDPGACCSISGIIRDWDKVNHAVTGTAEIFVCGGNPVSTVRDLPDQTVEAGSTFTVTLTLTANEDIQAPALNEDLPAGWTVTEMDNDGAIYRASTTEWVWAAAMSSGDTRTLTYEVTVPVGATPQDYDITGQASAYDVDPVDISGESTVTVEPAPPDDPISAVRDIPDRIVEPGSTFMVTLTLTANEDIQAPALNEDLPAGWTVTEMDNDGAIYSASTTEWVWAAAMSSGDTRTLTYEVTVPVGATPQDYDITGQASAYDVDPVDISGESTVTVEPAPPDDPISAVRDIPDRIVEPGSTFMVTLTLTANEDIQAPALNEDLPAGWTVTEMDNDGAIYSASTTEWVWAAAMSSGDTRTLTYEVTVPVGATPQDYDITGQASAYDVDPVDISGESTVTVEPAPPDDPISAVRDIPDRIVEPGSTFMVTLTLTANEDIQAPALNEDLPAGWTITEMDNDGAIYSASTTEWVWAAAMSSGDTRTLTYEVTVPVGATPQDYDITGQASAYDVDPVDISGESTVTVEPAPPDDPISAVRDIPDRIVEPGSTFMVTLTLTANEDIQAPALNEDLPAGWTITEMDNDGAIYRASTTEWVWAAAMSSGDTRTLTYEVTVPVGATPQDYDITGQASAYDVDPVDISGESIVTVV